MVLPFACAAVVADEIAERRGSSWTDLLAERWSKFASPTSSGSTVSVAEGSAVADGEGVLRRIVVAGELRASQPRPRRFSDRGRPARSTTWNSRLAVVVVGAQERSVSKFGRQKVEASAGCGLPGGTRTGRAASLAGASGEHCHG